jgi:two-component system, sensor histidine kinase and response regulator
LSLEYPQFVLAMFDCMGEGVYAIDAEGHVLLINPAACRMLGYAAEDIIGKVMHDTTHYKHPDGSPFPKVECAGFKVITRGKTVSVDEDYFIRKDGTFVPVSYMSSPILRDGEVVGAVVAFQDISARLKSEEMLRKVQEHHRLVYRASQIGTWEWNVDSDTVFVSPEFAEIVGSGGAPAFPLAQFQAKIFYDSDRQLFQTTLEKALRTNKEFKIEFRIHAHDNVRWLLAMGKPFYNRGNTAVLGVLIDTTELKQRQAASPEALTP